MFNLKRIEMFHKTLLKNEYTDDNSDDHVRWATVCKQGERSPLILLSLVKKLHGDRSLSIIFLSK